MQRIGLNGRLKVALSIVFAIIFCALLVVVDRVTKNYFSKFSYTKLRFLFEILSFNITCTLYLLFIFCIKGAFGE